MKVTKVFKLTWVVLSIVSAFVLGLSFEPGTAGQRRLPPALNMQQLQQRMPQSGSSVPKMMPPRPSPQYPYRDNR